MAVVLRSEVKVYKAGFRLGSQFAIMDLHDNGQFVLIHVDQRSGQFLDRVFDTDIRNLSVKGASTYLTITSTDRVKRRVDFASDAGAGMLAFGLLGAAISSSLANKSGLQEWVATFRRYGVLRSFSHTWRNIAIMLGATFALIIILILIAVASRGGQ